MKKITLFLFYILFFSGMSIGQYIQDAKIDSIVNLISQQRISQYMRELSGDTVTIINGVQKLIFSRYYTSPANDWAAQYIYEKFQSFGLNPQYQVINGTCKNVIAVKQGTRFPNQKYIIGAHYDNIIWPINPGPYDTVHGADDNASGVCGVLETARLLANMSFDYTIVFATWDQEESNPVPGSTGYADSSYAHGDSIKAYINMDMIAWNYSNQNKLWSGSDSSSIFFNDIFRELKNKYSPTLSIVLKYSETYGSDQLSFIQRHYRTFNVAEYLANANPNYHKITDNYENANIPYCVSLIKPTVAMLMVFALNKNAFFQHVPVSSSYDTTSRIVTVIIKFPEKLSTSTSAPRLYYKVNYGAYSYINTYYQNLDTFKFIIPGQPQGAVINYYIAAQDSTGYVCTYPVGGSGANPPGTVPPATQFTYYIWFSTNNFCSNNLKPIIDFEWTQDTIHITQQGIVRDVDVTLNLNHTNDGDLFIRLAKLNSLANLSQFNGQGGQNYTGTIFDDSATIPITQGTPPFTGRFKPQGALSNFGGLQMEGDWIIKIYDANTENQGNLLSWCIQFKYENSIEIKEKNIIVNEYKLFQNYPNPFNPNTNIKFQVASYKVVKLSVFDVLGREIETLINEKLKSGEYEVIFNGSKLPSGVYFYRLVARDPEASSGQVYTEVKRMILIK